MKKCTDVKIQIEEYLNKEISKPALDELLPHINSCPECRKYYEKIVKIREFFSEDCEQLHQLPETFDTSLHQRLVVISQNRKEKEGLFSFVKEFLSLKGALIATLSLFITMTFVFYKIDSSSKPTISHSTSTYGEPVAIRLEYYAENAVKDAVFSIDLDDGIAFYSKKYSKINLLRKHSWHGSLKKGKNSLPFVVKVNNVGKMNITAKAIFEGHKHSHKLEIEVLDKIIKVTRYTFPKEKIVIDG